MARAGDMSTGKMPPMLTSVKAPKKHEAHTSNGVVVKGVDDVLVRLSRCCNPVPGDDILGFVTRGRGVSVHRADCPNAQDLSKPPSASSRWPGRTICRRTRRSRWRCSWTRSTA